jgi:hypothetical protein
MKDNVVDKVKAWLMPLLLSGFCYIFYSDIREMKSDIKVLLGQSREYSVRITTAERDIAELKDKIITYERFPAKHEEIFDTKRNLR